MVEVELVARAFMWLALGFSVVLAGLVVASYYRQLANALKAPVHALPSAEPTEVTDTFDAIAPDLDPVTKRDIRLARLDELYESGIVPKYLYEQAKERIDQAYIDEGGEIYAEN